MKKMLQFPLPICLKKVVCSLVLSFFFYATFAQSTKNVTFNFQKKTFVNNEVEQLQEGDFYQLKIINLNSNLYKVALDTKDTIIEQKVNFPAFGGFDLDNLSKVIAGVTSFNTSLVIPQSKTVAVNDPGEKLTADKKFKKVFYPLSENDNKKNDAITGSKVLIEETKKEILHLQAKIFKIKIEIDELALKVEYYIRKSDIEFKSKACSSGLNSPGFGMGTLVGEVATKRSELISLQSEIGQVHGTYLDKMKHYILTLPDDAGLKASDESINKSFEELKKTVSAALDSINAEKTGAVITRMIQRDNNNSFEYLSPPIQYSGGVGVLKFSITPRADVGLLQPYSSTLKFPLKNRSVTVLGAGFYAAMLKNEVLSVLGTKSGTDTSYSFVKEKDRNVEIGVYASISRAIPIGTKNTFWNLTVGPAVSLSDKVRPRIIFGSGLSFGKRNMLTIGVGGITGYVDKKSEIVDKHENFTVKPESGVVSGLRLGVYANVGYQYNF